MAMVFLSNAHMPSLLLIYMSGFCTRFGVAFDINSIRKIPQKRKEKSLIARLFSLSYFISHSNLLYCSSDSSFLAFSICR